MDSPFSAFVTNLGAYNEGELKGEWVDFPVSEADFNAVLDRIGIDETHEEYFISDYDMRLDLPELGEFESIDSLNLLAETIQEMPDPSALCAALEDNGEDSVSGMVNTARNIEAGNIIVDTDIKNETDLGKDIASRGNDFIGIDSSYRQDYIDDLKLHIDYEGVGRTIADDYNPEITEDWTDGDYFDLGKDYIEDLTDDDLLGLMDNTILADNIDYEGWGRDELLNTGASITENGYVYQIANENLLVDNDDRHPLVAALEDKGFKVEIIGASPVMLDAIETENEEMKRDGSIHGYIDERYDEFEPGGGSGLDEGIEVRVTFENGDEIYFCTLNDGYLMQDRPFDIGDAPSFSEASEKMSMDEVCEECETFKKVYVDDDNFESMKEDITDINEHIDNTIAAMEEKDADTEKLSALLSVLKESKEELLDGYQEKLEELLKEAKDEDWANEIEEAMDYIESERENDDFESPTGD